MLFFIAALVTAAAAAAQVVSHAGDSYTIAGWSLQSSANLSDGVTSFSQPGASVSSWYRVPGRGSVMAGLIENGVFSHDKLLFSDDLDSLVNYADYEVPWLYREEFPMTPTIGQHYFLITHGITSRADIWINGHLVASNETQVGSYGGQTYEISDYLTNGTNCLLVQAHPTNYLRDFAMGKL